MAAEPTGGQLEPVMLGSWPTPVEPAPRLAVRLGLAPADLWIKRDDLGGPGGGGNKIRKLQWTCAAALAAGATTLVTTGAAQSNHARLTAAAGARLGLDVVLVLAGAPGATATGNLALDGLFGAAVVWAGDVDDRALDERALAVADDVRERGGVPAVNPFGGSSTLSARGYVECGNELEAQLPDLAQVVVAVGSGATMAGLVHALGPDRVLGVDSGAVPDPADRVDEFVGGLTVQDHRGEDLWLRRDQVGPGYGHLTEPARAALTLAARTEGLVLDPIYTGRAMAGLAAAVADGTVVRGQRTVFLHSGGLPGFFGHPDALAHAAGGFAATAPG
jgi:D-cysteine desulfhydrase